MRNKTEALLARNPSSPKVARAKKAPTSAPFERPGVWDAWLARLNANLARDPFHIGRRLVKRRLPNGVEIMETVPLTLEDLLNAHEEDRVSQADPHSQTCNHLWTWFHQCWHQRYRVFDDHRINWGIRGVGIHSPDLAVFDLQRMPDWRGDTLYPTRENRGAKLVVEVTSESTAMTDLEDKHREYRAAHVENYLIVDLESPYAPRLWAFARTRRRYREIAPNKHGWVPLPIDGYWLGLVGENHNEVAMYDRDGIAVHHPRQQLEVIHAKEAVIIQKEAAITQKDRVITQQSAAITQKDRVITQQSAAITQKDRVITQKDRVITQQSAVLTQKEAAITQKDAFIASQTALLEQERLDRAAAQASARDLAAQLAALQARLGIQSDTEKK